MERKPYITIANNNETNIISLSDITSDRPCKIHLIIYII